MVAWRHVKRLFSVSSIAHLSVSHTSDLQTAKATQMSFIFWLAYPRRKWNRLQGQAEEIYQVMNTKCHLPPGSRSVSISQTRSDRPAKLPKRDCNV